MIALAYDQAGEFVACVFGGTPVELAAHRARWRANGRRLDEPAAVVELVRQAAPLTPRRARRRGSIARAKVPAR